MANRTCSLSALAVAIGEKVEGGDVQLTGVAPLHEATGDQIAFVADRKAVGGIGESKAGALIVPNGTVVDRPSIVTDNPRYVFAKALGYLIPGRKLTEKIHETAVIDESVSVGKGVHVGPHVFIDEGSVIGDGAIIRAGVKIGANCVIAEKSVLYENVALYDGTTIGARTIIHANTTIGSDGFGYAWLEDGTKFKIPHTGSVRIDEDVEIGANSSIDRGTLGVTIIRRGTKLDNQVHIGHNCDVGEDCIMAGCSGLSGSVTLKNNVTIAGLVGVVDNVTLCSGVTIVGHTGVHKSLTEPGYYSGPMVMKHMDFKRFLLLGKKVESLSKRIKELEKERE